MPKDKSKQAWVTLLTRPSYLAGVIILSHTLRKHSSAYPLIVLVTASLPQECISVLEHESQRTNQQLLIHQVEPLNPPNGKTTLIASRFEDTWTKLRIFSLTDYSTLIFLDADIMICQSMDSLFSLQLPGPDWLAANHACVCNLDRNTWAPGDWMPDNCAYTPVPHPLGLTHPTPAAGPTVSKQTHRLLNSGLFIFHPSPALWDRVLHFFNTSPTLETYLFPDQNFLDDFFRDRWLSIGWQWNALKTMRYWHPEMWRDAEVRGLHYIVDKPWAKRIASDGIAGHLGRDGLTHAWWWGEYEGWEKAREEVGDEETLRVVRKFVAPPLETEEADRAQVEEHRKAGFPIPVPGRPGVLDETESADANKPGGPVLRAWRPGERGHGPVVRN